MFIKIPKNKQMKEKGKLCGHSISQKRDSLVQFPLKKKNGP